jgi:O-antigen/teichoic acid export membrane protein
MNQQEIQKIDKLSTSYKFAKNSIYNVIGFIVTFPILILLTPYMLKVLGKAQFGIWAIAGVVTSYAQLSDMGMTTAIVKFVAEHWVKRDVARISKVVSTAFFSFAVAGGIVVVAFLLARNFIVINLLKVPSEMQAEAIFVVSGVAIIFYFNLVFSVYNSILVGLQRMDITNAITVVSKISRALGMWIFLAAGMGLKGLIWNSAIFSIFTVAPNVFFAKRLLSGFKLNPFLVSILELKEIVKYSANIFAARLMGLFQDPINKIVLATYTSLPFVSFYEVGWRVTSMVRSLFGIALMPLLPASSELQGESNKQELERIYLSISRVLYLFAVPFVLVMMVLAKPLVQVWLGEGYELAGRAMQYLLLGNLFSLLVTPQYVILQGIGKPQINTIAHAIAGGTNLILSIVLVQHIGFNGVLVSGLISLLVSSLYIDCLFRRTMDINIRKYLQQLSGISIVSAVMLSGSLIYFFRFVNVWDLEKLILFSMGSLLFYLVILNFARVTNDRDKRLLRQLLKVVKLKKYL